MSISSEQLESQIMDLDLDALDALVAGRDIKTDFAALGVRRAAAGRAKRRNRRGLVGRRSQTSRRRSTAGGEVAAVLVAGGQGTRLGFDQPKGMFKIGPVSGRTLFQFFADRLDCRGRSLRCADSLVHHDQRSNRRGNTRVL